MALVGPRKSLGALDRSFLAAERRDVMMHVGALLQFSPTEHASPDFSRHLREELAGPNTSAVQRLLAERAALWRFDCYLADTLDIQSSGGTIGQAELSLRRRDHADRRNVSALKALAAVRKLPIVAVQVNVGTDVAPGPLC